MLFPLIARHAERAEREEGRFAAWWAALHRFRKDWKNGRRPSPRELADYLRDVSADLRGEALQDLIGEHLRCSWREGRGPKLEEYPLGGTAPPDLVEDEFLARHQPPHGDMPSPEEYRRRFPEAVQALEARRVDHYVKLRRIGVGAMGEVWEACEVPAGRRVALKAARPGLSAEERRRFQGEPALLAELDHPGIVRLLGVPPHGRYFVTQFVEGRTLAERIREFHRAPEPLLWRRLVESFLTVCEAVAHAHGRGIIHCDLKPGNVLVGEHGETVIVDWGLAKRMDAPADGVAAGTPESMAPEQAEGRADKRSDVFGLGAILHEILTGRPPRVWHTRPADWPKRVREGVESPRGPRGLAAICRKAMARNPEDRYGGAREMAEEARRVLSERGALGSGFWRRLFSPRA